MAMTYLTKLKPEPMGAHSLSTAYGVNSLVMSEDGAAAYISVKDVPAGTPLTNTDYWQPHTDLTAVVQSADAAAQKANAARDEMLEIARNLTDMVEKSGNPVQAELVGGLPFDRVETVLNPVQSGSGDPSPSNIRSISGWTGARLTRCGKNLLNPNNMINAKQLTKPGEAPAIKNGYGWKRAAGNTEPVIGQTNNLTVMKVNTTYTVSFVSWVIEVGSTISLSIDCYPDTLPETSINITSTPTKYSWTFSTTDEAIESAKIRFFNTNNYDVNICVVDVQLEKGSTATEYEPYHGNTYTADFGQTVYGGTLDWQTGVLTVDSGIVTLDGNNLKALYMSSGTDYIQVRLGDKLPDARNQAGNGCLICSHLIEQYGIYSDFPYPHVYLDVSGTPFIRAYFPITIAKTENELNAYLASQYAAGTPVQVCYKLATPTTIQLTQREIKQLQGVNTLYGDGSIAMTGRADKALALDARIAALEAAG